jgi:hypothetical protein
VRLEGGIILFYLTEQGGAKDRGEEGEREREALQLIKKDG